MVSISAALIPFLEHDDANRALMGSNMQRQAVPLLRSERPLVGTGMEYDVARDSGACLLAEGDGVVRYADAERVIVAYDNLYLEDRGGVRSYDLLKYHKSNQNSCFGQKPTCYSEIAPSCSPTVPASRTANWPSARTWWWPSCPGAATTTKTPCSSPSAR